MPTYDINGVPVEFPYDAYECQLVYMRAVVSALQTGQNALLESPTGTGKTLCLLCATLGWRRHHERLAADARMSWGAQAVSTGDSGTTMLSANTASCPRIWYSSRTHSQIQQVVKELKRTTYRPSSVVLGSREHMCIHTSVSRYTGAKQNALCRRARDENRCAPFVGLRKGQGNKVTTSVRDIEEIVSACRESNICPFYKCRDDAKEVELLFIPYDYLINPQTRESLGVSLRQSVIIFDEGHNIEKSCESVASIELTASDLARAVDEVAEATELLEQELCSCEAALGDMTGNQLMSHLNLFKRNLLALEDSIYAEDLIKDEAMAHTLLKAPGSYILKILGRGSERGDGLTPKDLKRVATVVQKAISVLTFSTAQAHSQAAGLYLDKIQTMLQTVFKPGADELDKNYQFLLYEDAPDAKRGSKRKKNVDFFSAQGPTTHKDMPPRTLCLWCFSSSVAMRELQSREVRSLIITSGTLSPIEGTVEAFGVPFPFVLENSHVINPKKQVWGGVLSTGAENITLNASFGARDEPSYLRELGAVVAHFASCVPDGVLLAFQSYARKEHVLRSWRQAGIFEDIARQKPVFEEPPTHGEMKVLMQRYNDALARPAVDGQSTGGAILAAVCRGKLCEGIDFTDRQCRMVIMVGIPYPSRTDLRVLLKQAFLERKGAEGDGRRWYTREAVCAVNQTLGRVIRHRHDYGGVLLCDERFARDGHLSFLAAQIPSWLRSEVKVHGSFEIALNACRQFFGGIVATTTASTDVSTTADQTVDGLSTGSAGQRQDMSTMASALAPQSSSASTPAASSQRSFTAGGTPLSALGALWKDRRRPQRLDDPPQCGGAVVAAPVVAPSAVGAKANAMPMHSAPKAVPTHGPTLASSQGKAAPLQGLAVVHRPAAQSSHNGIFQRARGNEKMQPKRAETSGATAWLRAVEGLLPRMEFDCVRQQLDAMQVQMDAISSTGVPGLEAGPGADIEKRLEKAMAGVAESLLPEFCFDTPAEARRRDDLVRDCGLLLPALFRPLWRSRVEEVFRSQERECHLWGPRARGEGGG